MTEKQVRYTTRDPEIIKWLECQVPGHRNQAFDLMIRRIITERGFHDLMDLVYQDFINGSANPPAQPTAPEAPTTPVAEAAAPASTPAEPVLPTSSAAPTNNPKPNLGFLSK